ncbi:hypothetical protein [Actinocrispum wychmicini]|uniref:hypothetical protein n=1 Tax=Actinocrispum wychmicini TaxID=1213861 RepID=UPI001A9E3ACD|nr:hypothetical protein [Actinocrispum wychmicini]
MAGGVIEPGDVTVAFYGDLFRPAGARSLDQPDYEVSDVDDPDERELLRAWWLAAVELEHSAPEAPTRVRTPQWVQRAVYALSGSRYFEGLTERALIGGLKQVRRYFAEADTRRRIRTRLLDVISADTAVVIGHSLGSVVAYECLSTEPGLPVSTLVTLGSPLGLPKAVFDRLDPPPIDGRGHWPHGIHHWTNITDAGDLVANPKELAPLFGSDVVDITVHNGAKAHDMRPYLTARETGSAVLAGLRRSRNDDM